jgi:hypothetical protein
MAASKRKKSTLRDLFFIRRFPKRQVTDIWERPEEDAAYAQLLEYEDFLTLHFETDKSDKYPVVIQDLKDLDEHLLPAFFEFSQKSKYFQNMFYTYQWVFIMGTFGTTVLGVLITYLFNTPEALDSIPFKIITLMTSLVSAVIAALSALANRRQPQRRWAMSRRAAEELRMNYFIYISHITPYDQQNRLDLLRTRIVELQEMEEQDV